MDGPTWLHTAEWRQWLVPPVQDGRPDLSQCPPAICRAPRLLRKGLCTEATCVCDRAVVATQHAPCIPERDLLAPLPCRARTRPAEALLPQHAARVVAGGDAKSASQAGGPASLPAVPAPGGARCHARLLARERLYPTGYAT